MTLSEMRVHEFIEMVSSKEPAPGEGSVAALTAALGTGLAKMTAGITKGKRRYAKYELEINALLDNISKLQATLEHDMELDADAILAVREAIFLPDGTMDEKQEKVDVMDLTLKASVMVPCDIIKHCLEGLELIEKDMDKLSDDAMSDLGSAAVMLDAGIKSAYLAALSTMRSLGDDAFIRKYKTEAADALAKGNATYEKIYAYCIEKISTI